MRKLVPLAIVVALLAGCGKSGGSTTTSAAPATTAAAAPSGPVDKQGCRKAGAVAFRARTAPKPTTALDPKKTYDVTFATNCGSFTVRLDQKQSPHATASIVSLVHHGFYDRTVFHRIVPGFVIQGGDPTGTGAGGPGYSTVDTPPVNATYSQGVVAMAKTTTEAPGTAGSQFFVVTAADAGLTPDYAIVGTVVKGQGVVDRIGKLGNASEQPTRTVEITKATVATS